MDKPSRQPVRGDMSGPLPGRDRIFKEIDSFHENFNGAAQMWEMKYKEIEIELEKTREEFEKLRSKHWELQDHHEDKCRELQQAQVLLRDSIPLSDWRDPPEEFRTAEDLKPAEKIKILEKEQERLKKTIEELKRGESKQ